MKRASLLIFLVSTALAQPYTISTLAGTGKLPFTGGGTPAGSVRLIQLTGIAADSAGNIFFGDSYYQRVFRISASGSIAVYAGNGQAGSAGDGGPAVSAQLNLSTTPCLAVDAAGNLYIADAGNARVRKVTPAGTISTATPVAGSSVALDAAGNLYVSQSGANVVHRVRPDGTSSIIAGSGKPGYSGDGGPATSAQLTTPEGLRVDAAGNVYVADFGNHVIRKITPQGVITTVAGNGKSGFTGDGGLATAATLTLPMDVAIGPNGNLYIADSSNSRVRMVGPNGAITTVAGGGGSLGDGPAVQARLIAPSGIAFDNNGNLLLVVYYGGQVKRVTSQGGITTVAGLPAGSSLGDNIPAINAPLLDPAGVITDSDGNEYVSDNIDNRIRRISAAGVITTLAGTGVYGSAGEGGPAAAAEVGAPRGLGFDSGGNLYVTLGAGYLVRRIAPNGTISAFAGNGAGFFGDGGSAMAAQFLNPQGVVADAAGNIYIADNDNNRIRRVDTSGKISTIAGTGAPGFNGDGIPAITAQLFQPRQLAMDKGGNLYIADTGNNRVRRITPDGNVATVAGNGIGVAAGDGGPAVNAQVPGPSGVAVDSLGNLYIASSARIRKVDAATGTIRTIAGTGVLGFSGDGGAATSAMISGALTLAVDPAGNVFFTDRNNNRVRKLAPQYITGGGVVNAASLLAGAVAPGEAIVINVAGIDLTQTGAKLLFDGTPATVISLESSRITAIVPYAVDGAASTQLQIVAGTFTSAVSIPIAAAAPGIFTQDSSGMGAGVVTNEDSSMNSPSNPAAHGSFITISATGEGQTDPAGVDGLAPAGTPPIPLQQVSVQIGGIDAQVLSAGGTPNQPAGYFQVIVQVPDGAPTGDAIPLVLNVGGVASQPGVTMSVQ